MDDFNSGCVIGIVVLLVVAALLWLLWMIVSAYWEVFLIAGIVLGILITWLSLKASRKRKLKLQRERMEYEGSTEGKFNIAIHKCVNKRQEQENTLKELQELLKEKLDQIFKKFSEEQTAEKLIYHFKGRQRYKIDVERFETLYGETMENEIREMQIRFPEKTAFAIKYEIRNYYEDLYFKPGYYYENKYRDGLYEETIDEVLELIADTRNQVEICEKMIDYYSTLEHQLKETKQNYRASESARKTGYRVKDISQKSVADTVDLQRTKEEAEYAELVYKEYMKLTSEFKDKLTGSLQEVIKKDLDDISGEFKQELG